MWCASMGKGGWIETEIDAEHLQRLAERAPAMPPAMFRIAVSRFREDKPASPAKVRNELSHLADATLAFAMKIEGLSDEAEDALALAELRDGGFGFVRRLSEDVRRLESLIEIARRDAEKSVSLGRGTEEVTRLVLDLIAGLRMGGAEIDSRSKGQLVRAFSLALEAAGYTLADHRGKVKDVLRKLGGK